MKKSIAFVVALLMAVGTWAQTPLRSKKYKGFVNFDITTVSYHSTSGSGNYSDGGTSVHFELTTSHGVQNALTSLLVLVWDFGLVRELLPQSWTWTSCRLPSFCKYEATLPPRT